MREKIRVLFLAANPIDAGHIRLDEEAREIGRQIQGGTHSTSFELVSQFATRPNNLQHALLKYRPHILHFSGHGKGPQGILLEDEAGNSKLVSLQAISDLFRILKDKIRVVVFNACFSKPQAQAFNELIDYTIGTTSDIGDAGAIAFAASFYRALAFGLSVRDGFDLANNELALNAILKTGTPKLFIRKGVDPSVSLVTQIQDYSIQTGHAKLGNHINQIPRLDEVKSTIERLSVGTATDSDAEAIHRALVAGSIVLEQTEESGPLSEENKTRAGLVAKVESTRGGTTVDVRIGSVRGTSLGRTGSVTDASKVNDGTGYRTYDNSLDVELGVTAYERVQEKLFPQPLGLPPPLPSLIFVGREGAMSDVKTLLGVYEEDAAAEPKVVIIRSWPGAGKTTLVGFVGRDPEVQKAFADGVLWTAIGRNPELIPKMAEWGRALGTDDLFRAATIERATERLATLLRERRMLLIVDDIWKAEHAVPFLRAAEGSKCVVLATTRLPSVAEALTHKPEAIYVLPVLAEDDALELLRYFSPTSVDEHPDECRELVQELGHLPFALHLAGRLLRTELTSDLSVVDLVKGIREGARVLEEDAPLDRTEGTVLSSVQALLKRSTDELDKYTRDCFAYLGPFAPKPATFDIDAMKAMWRIDDPLPVIRNLVGHGLLEPTGNGRFHMHALLVKHARSLLDS